MISAKLLGYFQKIFKFVYFVSFSSQTVDDELMTNITWQEQKQSE